MQWRPAPSPPNCFWKARPTNRLPNWARLPPWSAWDNPRTSHVSCRSWPARMEAGSTPRSCAPTVGSPDPLFSPPTAMRAGLAMLTAGVLSPGLDAVEEVADQHGNLFRVRLQREVTSVQQVNLRVGKIPLISVCASRNERRIMASPHGKKRRTMLAKIGLESRVQRHIAAIVQGQIKLNVLCARARHVRDIKFISIW